MVQKLDVHITMTRLRFAPTNERLTREIFSHELLQIGIFMEVFSEKLYAFRASDVKLAFVERVPIRTSSIDPNFILGTRAVQMIYELSSFHSVLKSSRFRHLLFSFQALLQNCEFFFRKILDDIIDFLVRLHQVRDVNRN